MKRNASATWHGSLVEGHGELNAESGIFSGTPYSFGTRFENEPGTNPEELIGAAHAAAGKGGSIPEFKQTRVSGANHFFQGHEKELVQQVLDWLQAHAN